MLVRDVSKYNYGLREVFLKVLLLGRKKIRCFVLFERFLLGLGFGRIN